jgi:flavin-dependent dehydrogenase
MSPDPPESQDDCFGIVVVGGGPAGCAAALTARRAGLSVALIDRSRITTDYRAVERIAPVTREHLANWGLLDQLPEPIARACSSVVSAWERDEPPRVADAIFDPFGGGWIVERHAFDEMLRNECRRRGADIRRGSVMALHPQRASWTIEYECDGARAFVQARRIVLAPGRGTSLLRPLTARANRTDKWIAILGRSDYCEPSWRDDSSLFVEKTRTGWMYGMPAPSGGSFIGVCVPAAILADHKHGGARHIWQRSVACSRIREPADSDLNATVWCRPMTGRVAEECVDESWTVVGDAVQTVDPLSGLGVAFAFESGRQAVEEPAAYGNWIRAFRTEHDANREAFYAAPSGGLATERDA